MAYSGTYKVKNPKKYKGDHTQVIYRSLWERHAFRWCDENPKVKWWSSEETIVPYFYEVDKRYHRYFPDLKIHFTDGKTILVEIKPEKETSPPTGAKRTKRYITEGITYVKNMNKWQAADKYAKDNGWEFQIWTEKTLTTMGIMPKSTKPLKKLKPLPKYSRKKSK